MTGLRADVELTAKYRRRYVRDAAIAARAAEANLHRRIRAAAEAGVSVEEIAEDSGLSPRRVRAVLGRSS